MPSSIEPELDKKSEEALRNCSMFELERLLEESSPQVQVFFPMIREEIRRRNQSKDEETGLGSLKGTIQ